jgi:Ca2+-binding RTX toxin-like protein
MRLVALAALVVLGTPGLAQAATAEVVSGAPYGAELFFYNAAPGEANQVDLSVASGTIAVHDSGASITAGDGCQSVSANEVICTITFPDFLSVRLGDLNDSFTLASDLIFWNVEAGSGDDTLIDTCVNGCGELYGRSGDDTLQGGNFTFGGPGEDSLTGTSSADLLAGGANNDTLVGLGANDRLAPGLGDDSVDGGAGADEVSFATRGHTGVSADLRTGVATGQGTDTLISIERLFGSAEDDHLSGNSQANRLEGFGGDDVILGRGGDDRLTDDWTGSGNDRLFGGLGEDRLSGGDGSDFLRGGTGADILRGRAGPDRLRAKDGFRDEVRGGDGIDRARVDRALDFVSGVERVLF